MGRMPAAGAWMRRLTLAASVALVLTTVHTTPARAEVVGDGPFLVSNPSLTWPCADQGVYLDTTDAPSAWHVQVVKAALVRFRSASGRAWPLTDDPKAPVRIRWYDPDGHEGALTSLGADAVHYRGADVQLSPKIGKEWLYSTVLHELGHVGGLDHVADPSEVMGLYPSAPHARYEVGDLVGLLVANRGCSQSAVAAGRLGIRSR